MLKQGDGHIINVSSGAGLFPVSYVVPYSAAKHAVVALSLGIRAEAAASGVKVSVACPGAIRTNMSQATAAVNFPREIADEFLSEGMEASKAAYLILKGMVRNRATIIFPGSIRFMWWVRRWFPSFWNRLSLLHVKILRKKIEDYNLKSANTPSPLQ